MTFGQKLEYAMNKKGLTQAELARQLEVSPSYISKMIRLGSKPNSDLFITMCKLFGVTAAYFSDENTQTFETVQKIRLRGRPLAKNSIHDILRDEKYSGMFVYRKGTKTEHRHTREDAIRVPGIIPEIISREIWERCSARMEKRKYDNG